MRHCLNSRVSMENGRNGKKNGGGGGNRAEDFDFCAITAPLTAWFAANKRDLPWRENPTPYRVWVSEIMLQQTRVEAARDYYLRFLNALPAVEDLAACDEETLMKLWEGLGYYSRARNLHKTAKIVCEEYGGEFPADEKSLRALPGIGDYTVGAIRSIAFGLPAPAVDGNVLRVCARLSADGTEISDENFKARLKALLAPAYPETPRGCSDFTQALMELGALICTPRSPACGGCPLNAMCIAHARGAEDEYPVLPEKKPKREQNIYAFVILTPRGIAFRKRNKGVLRGLNEFPSEIVDFGDAFGGADGGTNENARALRILKEQGVSGAKILGKHRYAHIFTHVKWNVTAFTVTAESAPFEAASAEELRETVAFPTAFRRCLDYLGDFERGE